MPTHLCLGSHSREGGAHERPSFVPFRLRTVEGCNYVSVRRLAALAVIGLVALAAVAQVLAQQVTAPPAATFSDVVEFVQKQGWQANMRSLCTLLHLPPDSSNCIFKQVSIAEAVGRGDPRGFNVPAISSGAVTHVLVYHLGPLVGEFFVVSPQGDLIKAFYRSKGTGYNPIPNADVEEEFKKDLAYWIENFDRVKQGLELERSQKK